MQVIVVSKRIHNMEDNKNMITVNEKYKYNNNKYTTDKNLNIKNDVSEASKICNLIIPGIYIPRHMFTTVDYEVIVPNKVIVVHFLDGGQEKLVCNEHDIFDLDKGLRIAIAKHVGRPYYNIHGIEHLADRLSEFKEIDKIINKTKKHHDKRIKEEQTREKELEEKKAIASRRKQRALKKKSSKIY